MGALQDDVTVKLCPDRITELFKDLAVLVVGSVPHHGIVYVFFLQVDLIAVHDVIGVIIDLSAISAMGEIIAGNTERCSLGDGIQHLLAVFVGFFVLFMVMGMISGISDFIFGEMKELTNMFMKILAP